MCSARMQIAIRLHHVRETRQKLVRGAQRAAVVEQDALHRINGSEAQGLRAGTRHLARQLKRTFTADRASEREPLWPTTPTYGRPVSRCGRESSSARGLELLLGRSRSRSAVCLTWHCTHWRRCKLPGTFKQLHARGRQACTSRIDWLPRSCVECLGVHWHVVKATSAHLVLLCLPTRSDRSEY